MPASVPRANYEIALAGQNLGFDADSSMTYSAGVDRVAGVGAWMGRYLTDVQASLSWASPNQRTRAAVLKGQPPRR